jgi:hypothetical protein
VKTEDAAALEDHLWSSTPPLHWLNNNPDFFQGEEMSIIIDDESVPVAGSSRCLGSGVQMASFTEVKVNP